MTLDLDAIDARTNAATPGPWAAQRFTGGYVDDDAYWGLVAPTVDHELGDRCDAEFCAHARTDVPLLVARLRELEAAYDARGKSLTGFKQKAEHRAERSDAALKALMNGINDLFAEDDLGMIKMKLHQLLVDAARNP